MIASSPIHLPQHALEPPAPPRRPLGLLAELTYRCPLHCPYCSNPLQYPPTHAELSTDDWRRVMRQAADLGVMHVLLSGGEPLARPDLNDIVAAAREAGLYTNLITSAVGLTRARAERLKFAGLDSVQISFQSDDADQADAIAGTRAHALKLDAARIVCDVGLPLTVNVVLHRDNIERLPQIIALAEQLGATRLELASTQFYGWAMRNRARLLPTREQVARADATALAAQERLRGAMRVLYVTPDYHATRPKPCMNGWGQRYLTVNPVGDVLPCPTAGDAIRDLRFDNVRQHDLGWIWRSSDAFNCFRGVAWMPEPCRTCDQRDLDFGGCRCQAAMLTGDASRADPVCDLSPDHATVTSIVAAADRADTDALVPLTFRRNPY